MTCFASNGTYVYSTPSEVDPPEVKPEIYRLFPGVAFLIGWT